MILHGCRQSIKSDTSRSTLGLIQNPIQKSTVLENTRGCRRERAFRNTLGSEHPYLYAIR